MKHHDLVRTALTLDDELDDIKRARIWSRLEDQLEQPAAPRARWPIMLGVSAVAAVAVLALVRMGGNATVDTARILAVPADTTVTANLGPFTRAALVGPAELELVGTPGEATAVRLRRGTLLADFTGGPGRSLRVEAPGATVEIVGTLFAVEARDGGSCTSVAHGRVRVTTASSDVFVGAGERYCTGSAEPQPIDETVRSALERHGSVITAKAAVPPSPPIAAAPAVIATAPAVTAPTPAAIAPTRAAIAPTPAPAPAAARPRAAIAPTAPPAPAPAAAPPRAAVTARMPTAPAPIAEPVVAPPPAPVAEPPPVAEPTPAPPVVVKLPAPPPTADDLYRSAEAALATGDLAAADRMLDRLLVAFPTSSLVDQALYERARIAYQQRAWATARRHLDRLAALPRTTLAEPGNYLACRIAVETKDGGAVPCLVEYRTAFPSSPHDLEALALVVKLTHASRGCAGVTTEIDELVRRHPRSKYAAAWRARCPEAR